MLNGIHLVDFGNHRDTRLTFGKMTALVGQNGAGKTGVLRGVMEVDSVARAPEQNSMRPTADAIRRSQSGGVITTAWSGPFEENDGDWGLKLYWSEDDVGAQWQWQPRVESATAAKWLPDPTQHLAANTSLLFDFRDFLDGPSLPPIPEPDLRVFSKHPSLNARGAPVCSYFKTAGNSLKGPSYSEKLPPRLGEDCRDLAWMIAYLKGDKDEVFGRILTAMREVVPVFRRVRHRPVAVRRLEKKSIVINKQERSFDEEQQVMGQELRFDMASGDDLPASDVSEGTLVTLAILTAVMQAGDAVGSQTILLDDIESGLHPNAQRDLIRQLRTLQETLPELQIIFTSHSPYIIDEMEPEDVWLFAPDAEGVAHAAQLSQHPDLERARGVLTTGELWSAEGESWVLDPKRRRRPVRNRVRRRPGSKDPVAA